MQIGHRRRVPLAVLDRQLEPARALLLGPVQVAPRQAQRLARFDHRLGNRMLVAHVGDMQRTTDGMVFARAIFLVLRFAKIRKDIVPRPVLAAELAPVVVIRALPAYVQHRIDRRRPAEYLAAWPDVLAPVRPRVGLGHIQPVDLGVLERLRIADGDVDHHVRQELPRCLHRPVVISRLEQHHARVGIFAEPRGEHAPGRARADDDIIGLGDVSHWRLPRSIGGSTAPSRGPG